MQAVFSISKLGFTIKDGNTTGVATLGSRSSNSKSIPESNDYPNPITAAAKTMTETNTGANRVRSVTSDNKQENPSLEALTIEFYTLLKHITEYLKQ